MNPLVLLAKLAIETYIEDKKTIPVPASPEGGEPRPYGREGFPKEFLARRAGVFVTIEKRKELRGLPRSEPKVLLRGCIGTYLPVRDNIAEEIIHNAIAAATEDWRFGPIKKTELPHLSYTVYILNKPEKVSDITELDPKKFG
ncbi:MAG: AMMECR1 domain-containing protein, partial [Patescibacteria group bacterium]